MRTSRIVLVSLAALSAACTDSPVSPTRIGAGGPLMQASGGRGVFQRYVAMGTSISMGVQSDGVVAPTQYTSWPAQLARMGDREITQPYIQAPGCPSPIRPPLALGIRFSGEPSLEAHENLQCAPLEPGVTLPTQNVAINGARAYDALNTTPENILDAGNAQVYARVLPPNMTQVSAMEAQNPKLVSVEFGSDELLGVRSGVAIVGGTIENPASFATYYSEILDHVQATGAKYGLLVGPPTRLLDVPAFRSGSEIAAQTLPLLVAFNVAVQPDCGTTNAQNEIFVTLKLSLAIQAGLGARTAGQPPVPFTCAASLDPREQDLVLTPAEQAVVTAVAAQITATIQNEAQARGFAYVSLDALYSAPGVRPPLDVVALFTGLQPFGSFISLDGLHPTAAGQALIAQAAAQALNNTYKLGIPIL